MFLRKCVYFFRKRQGGYLTLQQGSKNKKIIIKEKEKGVFTKNHYENAFFYVITMVICDFFCIFAPVFHKKYLTLYLFQKKYVFKLSYIQLE